MSHKFHINKIENLIDEMANNSIITSDDLPQYDLFLSQVIDFLNDKFLEDKYTNNIVQNYIKSEVITKPEDGKKRGYTKLHLAQLVLLSYMRPVLTTEEIKKVFHLAFNEINDRSDDIISWESAFQIFSEIQQDSFDTFLKSSIVDNDKLDKTIENLNLEEKDKQRIQIFIIVISLVAQASAIKTLVRRIVSEYNE